MECWHTPCTPPHSVARAERQGDVVTGLIPILRSLSRLALPSSCVCVRVLVVRPRAVAWFSRSGRPLGKSTAFCHHDSILRATPVTMSGLATETRRISSEKRYVLRPYRIKLDVAMGGRGTVSEFDAELGWLGRCVGPLPAARDSGSDSRLSASLVSTSLP